MTKAAMEELQSLRLSIGEISSLADHLEERISFLENKLALHAKSGLPSHYRMESDLKDFFDTRTAGEVRRPFSLVILQLDESFSAIRKTFPPSVNDWVLFQIGTRITEHLGPADRVFHTTDNEFILIVEELRGAPLKAFLKVLFDTIEETHVFSGFHLRVTARGGAAFYPEHSIDKSDLLHHADLAMGQALHAGKRFQLFSEELHHQVIDKAELQHSILKGLEATAMDALGHQFQMHYQPKLFLERLADGRYKVTAVSAESLLRWNHPTRGPVQPVHFVPLAEETGLILPLGKWTIFQVAEHLAAWQSTPMAKVGVSVNLSARQFRSDDVLEVVTGLVATGRIKPELLTLELTETSVFENPERAVSMMKGFKELGIKLSVDDFGTGYSSLSLLHKFPLDEIKIDRLFVEDIQNNPHDQSIVRSLVALAREMGLQLLAEGVDTPEVLGILYDTGCRGFQGWLLAKAMPPEAFARFYTELAANDFIYDPKAASFRV
jgi:EAL domain-containing protein (putative c-di-GMP-specific phosphodiesterase class I)/GGDEF domain-containing protein